MTQECRKVILTEIL